MIADGFNNKNIMYGSLSDFIDMKHKIQLTEPPNQSCISELSVVSKRQMPTGIKSQSYEALEKPHLRSKQFEKTKHNTTLLKNSLNSKQKPRKTESEHWVEKPFDKATLKRRHKLLRAVITTKQMQNQDNFNTPYDRSMNRMLSAYSKVKTQPIDSFLPPKMETMETSYREAKSLSPNRSLHIKASKLVSLENSVKWAKKHGKAIKSFYKQMGKSFELMSKERPGKNNYQLQKEKKKNQEEDRRRVARRKFLKQIQRRISTYDMFAYDEMGDEQE